MPSEEFVGDEDSSDEDDVEMKDADAKKKPEESANKPNPFGDDDDDSDDDSSNKKKEAAAKPAESKKPETDPFAEEDSDDNDNKQAAKKPDDKKTAGDSDDDSDDEEVGTPTKKKKDGSPEKKKSGGDGDDDNLLADSDDDDDDDVEFGGGDISGTGHNKGFQKKKSQKSAVDRLREAEAAEEQRVAGETAMDVDKDDEPAKPQPPKIDPRTMVVLEPDRPPDGTSLHVTKLPNLVGIQPEAFDPATYNSRTEEEEYGHVLDMIRWRYKKSNDGKTMMRDDQGKLIRESNARLIEWEDGSYTLHVGKEALSVKNVDSSKKVGKMDVLTGRTATFAGLNGYLYLSQYATNREPEEKDEEGDEEGAKKEKESPAGTVLECMGAVGSRMTAKPSSLASEAHKSLMVAVRSRTMKRAKISQVVTQLDPEKEKAERIRNKTELEKAKARNKNYRDGYSRPRSRPRMTSRYMEDHDGDYDTIGLGSLKKRTMNASDEEDFEDYADEMDDDEEEETFNRGKRPKKRAGASNRKSLDSDDDEDEDNDDAAGGGKDDDEEEEEDDEVITPVKSTKKRTHQAVFDDDDSDD